MNDIMVVNGIKGRLDENGMVELNISDVAIGLGFIQKKNNVEYIRWDRLNKYLEEFSFPTCGENDFIPENIFYKLCFKANNKIAMDFQDKVTNEILPSIRKTGMYSINKYQLTNKDGLTQISDFYYEVSENKTISAECKQEVLTVLLKELNRGIFYFDLQAASNTFHIQDFLTNNLVKSNKNIKGSEAYTAYVKWCKDSSFLIANKEVFYRYLRGKNIMRAGFIKKYVDKNAVCGYEVLDKTQNEKEVWISGLL